MFEQMLGRRTAQQLTVALKAMVAALVVMAVALVVIAVTSVIALA